MATCQRVRMSEPPRTTGVETLLGDPQRAVRRLSVPMIVAMSLQTAYNLFDAIWVSGLGSDALAAVGFAFPIFFVILGIGAGIGIGGSSAIARRIGAKDRDGAQRVLTHTILMTLVASLALSLPLFLFAEEIFRAMGAGDVTPLAVDYGRVVFGGAVVIMLANVLAATLRGEGDARRSSILLAFGSVLNIILDPILIYGLDMGIAGAAWATVIAFGLTTLALLRIYLIKDDTFIRLHIRGYRWESGINRDFLRVGAPASLQFMSMALTQFVMIALILMVDDTDGVAIYSTGWRVISLAIIPLQGIASAVTPITGAAYGAMRFDKLSVTHLYSVRFALYITVALMVLLFVFAPQIMVLFTWSPESVHLFDDLVEFMRIFAFMVPGVAFGMLSSATFQGMGMGVKALVATILRAVLLSVVFCYVLAVVLGLGLIGLWVGLCSANIIGSLIVFSWVRLTIRRIDRRVHA